MPAEEIGTLAQAVLKAYNKLAELRSSGAGQLAIKVAENALEKAKLAQQAATGSQQGMGPGAGGGMFAFGLPSFTQEQGMGISGGRPGGELMNEGPLGQLLAQFLPSIFGAGGGLPNAQQVPGGGNQYAESMMNRMGNRLGSAGPQPISTQPIVQTPVGSAVGPAELDRHLASRPGLLPVPGPSAPSGPGRRSGGTGGLPKGSPPRTARVAKQRAASPQPRPNKVKRI